MDISKVKGLVSDIERQQKIELEKELANLKPYWVSDCGRHTIWNADCLKVLRKLDANSIDVVVTDPPYGHNNNNGDLIHRWEAALGKGEHGEARKIHNDGDEANVIIQKCLPLLFKVLKAGSCCCCCCCGGGGPDPQFARWSLWIDKVFRFKQMVAWDKGPMGMGWHYRRSYETILVGEKPGAPIKWYGGNNKENIIRPGQYGIRKIIPKAHEHPTAKPVELYKHFIKLHAQPNEIVLDPFAGENPCGVAAIQLGLKSIAVEIDEKFCRNAVTRMKKELSRKV